jgi:hypothetical protein
MNWAMEQATGDPRAQCLLYVIADCASEEGIAWPGADWMAAKSQQSRATVYRRLESLQATGLLVMFPRWIDDNGKIWNLGAPGRRRTSPEIRLQFGVFIKQIEPVDDAENEPETVTPPSQPETGVSHAGDGQISHVRRGSSHYSDTKNHHLNQEDSPQPPSGGAIDLEGWKEFEEDWSEPILRQSIAKQVWVALTSDERLLARSAARGYFAHRKTQKNPSHVIGAQIFLRERDAWPRYSALDPGKPRTDGATIASLPVETAEARAVKAMYSVARVTPRESDRRVFYRGEIIPQVLAFADVPDRSAWAWIEDRQQLGAWSNFLSSHVFGARPPLLTTRGTGPDQRSGMYAPWPWPPRKDGSTGPPPGTLSDDDVANFK